MPYERPWAAGCRLHLLLPLIRRTRGVLYADALFGSPDIIAIVVGDDIKTMDEVIDRIASCPMLPRRSRRLRAGSMESARHVPTNLRTDLSGPTIG